MDFLLPGVSNYKKAIGGIFGDMKFDVVVGNPPYNRKDDQLIFVDKGRKLAEEYSLWIIPARWQAKEGKKNDEFRKNVVPYISSLVYGATQDIFEGIRLDGGVTYFCTENHTVSDKYINHVLIKDWNCDMGFDKTLLGIINKLRSSDGYKSITSDETSRFYPCKSYFSSKNFGDKPERSDYPTEDPDSPYTLIKSTKSARVAVSDFRHLEDMDKYKVYINLVITNKLPVIYILEPNTAMCRGSILLGYGTKKECESIVSYYSTKLIWYLVCNRLTGNANTRSFDNVPAPDSFDHEFTDDELYKKYGLDQSEIDIIESVIRDRAN